MVLDQIPVLVQRSQITITLTNEITPYIIRHFSDYFFSDFSEITAIIATSRELLFYNRHSCHQAGNPCRLQGYKKTSFNTALVHSGLPI